MTRWLPEVAGDAGPVASWLREPGSLTARCRRACDVFQIRLLSYRRELPVVAQTHDRVLQRVREVLLECDGRPVIFAHTEMPCAPRGPLSQWLARLGNRSLGSLLFSHPGFRRGRLEFRRLDARDELFRRAVAASGLRDDSGQLWARRSLHGFGRQSVLVTEVFLPSVLALEAGGRTVSQGEA